MIDDVYNYDWDKTGEKIVYSGNNAKIFIYDMESKKSTQILEGRRPAFSNNSQYIAYWANDNKLTVYDLNTKEEWKIVSLKPHSKFTFSPDDKYIALATQYWNIFDNPYFKIDVVDYKTGETTKLFKGEGGIPSFDWR